MRKAIFTDSLSSNRCLGTWPGRALLGLLTRSAEARIRDESPSVVVTGPLFAERFGSVRRITYDLLMTQAFHLVDAKPIVEFSRALNQAILAKRDRYGALFPRGIPLAEILSSRVVTAPVMENLARPAEAIRVFLELERIEETSAVTRESAYERYALWVSEHLGIRSRLLNGSPGLRLLSRVRERASLRRGGVSSVRHFVDFYAETPRLLGDDEAGDVLFFSVEERRLRRLPLLAPALREQGIGFSAASNNHKAEALEAARMLNSTGIRCEALNEFFPRGEAREIARRTLAQSTRLWSELRQSDRSALSHRYKGVPIFEAMLPLFVELWPRLASESAIFIEAAHRYLSSRRPRLVVLFDNSIHAASVAAACRELGIPTLLYIYNPLLFTAEYWMPVYFHTIRPDWVATGTEFMRKEIARLGDIPADRIAVTGDVFSDPTRPEERESKRAKLRGELGVGLDRKLVLVLSSYLSQDLSYEKKREFFARVFDAVRRIPSASIVIKAHPNETYESLAGQLEDWGLQAPIVHTASLRDCLEAADLAVVTFSQAGIETLQSGVPLVVIQDPAKLQGYERFFPYVTEGGAAYVPDSEDAYPVLRTLLLDEDARAEQIRKGFALLEKRVTPVDGMSGQRLAALLKRLSARRADAKA